MFRDTSNACSVIKFGRAASSVMDPFDVDELIPHDKSKYSVTELAGELQQRRGRGVTIDTGELSQNPPGLSSNVHCLNQW